jgi:hypothetical protein
MQFSALVKDPAVRAGPPRVRLVCLRAADRIPFILAMRIDGRMFRQPEANLGGRVGRIFWRDRRSMVRIQAFVIVNLPCGSNGMFFSQSFDENRVSRLHVSAVNSTNVSGLPPAFVGQG